MPSRWCALRLTLSWALCVLPLCAPPDPPPRSQLPKMLELVGLGYSAWFVWRYLLFKESRKDLAEDIEAMKVAITGKRDI